LKTTPDPEAALTTLKFVQSRWMLTVDGAVLRGLPGPRARRSSRSFIARASAALSLSLCCRCASLFSANSCCLCCSCPAPNAAFSSSVSCANFG
jgi:hypothetical protein